MTEFSEHSILLFMLNAECRRITPTLFTPFLVKAKDELVHLGVRVKDVVVTYPKMVHNHHLEPRPQ